MNSKFFKKTFVAAALLIGASGASHAVTVIDTASGWNGSDSVTSFGESNTATYGQTFTVTGPDTVLEDFTFYLDDFLGLDSVDFQAFVYAWDGVKATGPALYSGGALSTTNNGGADGFEQFTINTGGVSLTAGNEYVAFFSASNLFDGEVGLAKWGFLNGADVYSGGQFVFLNNFGNFGDLLTANWDRDFSNTGSDLAFTMNFSSTAPVPEPATMTLLGLGLVGMVARGRRSRKS